MRDPGYRVWFFVCLFVYLFLVLSRGEVQATGRKSEAELYGGRTSPSRGVAVAVVTLPSEGQSEKKLCNRHCPCPTAPSVLQDKNPKSVSLLGQREGQRLFVAPLEARVDGSCDRTFVERIAVLLPVELLPLLLKAAVLKAVIDFH